MLITACTSNKSDSSLNSGAIDFKIQYPQQLSEQSISNLLPEAMCLYYTPNELKFKIKGDLNIFSLEYLSRANGDSCFTLFKVVNRKLYYPLKENELWFLFDKNPPIIFKEYKDSTKIIAGFNCHKVMIAYSDYPDTYFDAYFTKEIKLNKKLFKSPFQKIEGIPLQYEVKYNNMTYKFLATKVYNSIGDEVMAIPDDYKLTTPTEIHDLVNSLLN